MIADWQKKTEKNRKPIDNLFVYNNNIYHIEKIGLIGLEKSIKGIQTQIFVIRRLYLSR